MRDEARLTYYPVTDASRGEAETAFQNSIVIKNSAKFGIIRPNFNWMMLCTVKPRKTKNRPNLPINRTELAEIQFNSSKIQWNSRCY
jgi:hypothetical protein